MKNKKLVVTGVLILVVVLLVLSYALLRSPWKVKEGETVKIFWVNSYHEDLLWSQYQLRGFLEIFDKNGINYEIKSFHLNTLLNGKEEDILKSSAEAMKIIDEWQPDLIYATDDNAQKYVGVNYINSNMLLIFSGVNGNEEDYGYDTAKNVVGLLERKPILESLNIMRSFYPYAKRITVIGDSGMSGVLIQEEARAVIESRDDFEIANWYNGISGGEDFKEKLLNANEDSDMIFFLWAEVFKDKSGEEVVLKNYSRWIVENVQIPELSLWADFTKYGGLLGVEVSAYHHGEEAGKLAERILIDGENPASIESYVPVEIKKSINLARAKSLDLNIPPLILINSDVYETFPWEEES